MIGNIKRLMSRMLVWQTMARVIGPVDVISVVLRCIMEWLIIGVIPGIMRIGLIWVMRDGDGTM